MIKVIKPGTRMRRILEFKKGNVGSVLGVLNDSFATWRMIDDNRFESDDCDPKEFRKILIELSKEGEFTFIQTIETD
jgi:hypothetical protein